MKRDRLSLQMDMGLLLWLIVLYGVVVTSAIMITPELTMPLIVFANLLFILVVLAYYFGITFALVSSILTVFGVSSYLLYRLFMLGQPIESIWYFWMAALPLGAVGMGLFQAYAGRLKARSDELAAINDRLTVVDEATGIPNERACASDMHIFVTLCARHKLPLCYLQIRLRYYDDLLRITGREGMQDVQRSLIDSIRESLRQEDKIYSMDERGTLGVILVTDAPGARIVASRIREKVAKPQGQSRSANDPLKRLNLQLSIGYAVYEPGMDELASFLEKAEKETEYDV